jgi:hypothetical protein
VSGVIVPAADGGLLAQLRGRTLQLVVRCAACGDVIPGVRLVADPGELEEHPVFVLCEQDYILIRSGYQRDRDRRARATYAAGQAAFGGHHHG